MTTATNDPVPRDRMEWTPLVGNTSEAVSQTGRGYRVERCEWTDRNGLLEVFFKPQCWYEGYSSAYWYMFASTEATLEDAQRVCEEVSADTQEVRKLNRTDAKPISRSPWGKPDYAKRYGPGVVFYTTPSHGGFKVDQRLNRKFPDELRIDDGWYEEDCDASRVVLALPCLFTPRERANARKTFEQWCTPEAIARNRQQTAA